MDEPKSTVHWMDSLHLFAQTARGTPMGDLLRQFWQPVALSRQLPQSGTAKAVRVFSEDFTLYRGESGQPYLVAGRCAHRCSRLHTGWVEGEDIRCIYHGWKYDSAGQCVEMPAEHPSLCAEVKIASYPVREYCGLVFAFLGKGEAPEFDLPRKEAFERPGQLQFTREQIWPANWFQQTENSLDAVHVSFVHQKGKVGIFGEAVSRAMPSLQYFETDAGIRQIATRGANNVRVSDWTFPNNNHILVPGISRSHPWMDISIWLVPIDDVTTSRFQIYSMPSMGEEEDRKIAEHFERHLDYNPPDHHDELYNQGIYPEEMALELVAAQDYVAVMGQGVIADRAAEKLYSSDLGIALQRKIFHREMAALPAGKAKSWKRLNEKIELQTPETLRAVQG